MGAGPGQGRTWGRGRRGAGLAPDEGAVQEAAVAQQAGPELDAHNAEDEEDEEAEQKDVPQHGQRVQQQGYQDAHACKRQDGAGSAEPLGPSASREYRTQACRGHTSSPSGRGASDPQREQGCGLGGGRVSERVVPDPAE